MNKRQLTATAMYSEGSYTSPAVKVVEVQAEGMLCISARIFLEENYATLQEWNDVTDLPW